MKKTTMPDWCVAVKKAMIDHDDMTVTELAKETAFLARISAKSSMVCWCRPRTSRAQSKSA